MRRLALLIVAAVALCGGAMLLFDQRLGAIGASAPQAAVEPRAAPAVNPGRVATDLSSPVPNDSRRHSDASTFQSNLAAAMGSEHSDVLSLFQQGTRAGASAGEQYIAFQIIGACLPSILRMQHAQFPEASGDVMRQVDDARARLARRCGDIERLGTDQILRDYQALRAAVLVEGSLLVSNFPSFIRARNDEQRKGATDRLVQMFSQFGPVVLQWASGDFTDYLYVGTTPFARQIREISDDKSVLHYAVSLALCMGSDICGGSLLYLVNCSDTALCGGTYLESLSKQFTAEQQRLAQPMARKILQGIATGEWAPP